MNVVHSIEDARGAIREFARHGRTSGLVPTMGALHQGHLSLIRAARARCEAVAVTIFVNPTQFGPGEDLDSYPRTFAGDLDACRQEKVDVVFAPATDVMYDADHATTVHVSGLTDHLCGAHRPGHFDGVATVVAKLFNILPADKAFFGEKDFQQLQVIRRFVRDLNIPIEIVGCPIVREADGLALSSRNQYLSPAERKQATSIGQALITAQEQVQRGTMDCAAICHGVRAHILAAGSAKIEYVEIVDPDSVRPIGRLESAARLCVAVHIGACRLIDNVELNRCGESLDPRAHR